MFFHVTHPLLRLKLLLHAKCNAAVVESLVRVDGHADLVSNPQQEQSSFWAVDRHVTDELIWAVR